MVTIDDFKNLDLRIGKIISAEKVDGSEKLLKLEVDIGPSASSGQGNYPSTDSTISPQAGSGQAHSINSWQDPSINSGQGRRQIIAGIGKQYAPEDLIGKNIVIVANLEPRTFTLRGASPQSDSGQAGQAHSTSSGQVGLESQGMILCADSENGPVLLMPEKSVPAGTKIR